MGGLDPAKLLVILVLALVLLGPERLPRAARQVGAFWREFTQFRVRLEEEVRSAMPDVDLPKIPVIPKSGLTGYLTGMMRDADRAKARGSNGTGGITDDDSPDDFADAGRSGAPATPWRSASGGHASASDGSNPSPVTAPSGMPAGWNVRGAEAPGYASGSLLSPLPSGTPEGVLGAEIRPDLDDPSWN
ncbi:MAG: twin-arginine translocase TatA/TatE family subunit [Acidimicrobiales bacterium]